MVLTRTKGKDGSIRLDTFNDFHLGDIHVRPQPRLIEGSGCSISLEPLAMLTLVVLSSRAGQMVSRRALFDACWGSTAVGDDSLNRVMASLRKSLKQVASGTIKIQTVPAEGYLLRLNFPLDQSLRSDEYEKRATRILNAARDSWRHGIPRPDYLAIEQLRQLAAAGRGNAAAWGMLALLCRYAAEYSDSSESAGWIDQCDKAARTALQLEPTQSEALVALATAAPLFGRWFDAHSQLTKVLRSDTTSFVATHEIAIVEMATGRVGEAKRLMDGLIAADPFAACFAYKSIWQRWSLGDLASMDQAAESAVQLWPTHPAVWTARFWTLAYTQRCSAALSMLSDGSGLVMPERALQLMRLVTTAAAMGTAADRQEAAEALTAAAQAGPATAIISLFGLGLLGRADRQFVVARSYYLREGKSPVPIRATSDDPTINDQHRRVTQILFTPACALMRSHSDFSELCHSIGLQKYWHLSGYSPDFLS